MIYRFLSRWPDKCPIGGLLVLEETSAMNRKRSLLARTGPTIVAAVMIAVAAGCHHKTAEDFLAEGDTDMQTTKLAEAEKAYQEAVKLEPNDPRTHISLGNLYVFEHNSRDAQVEFMKVLEVDPKNAATHAALGNLYSDQNQRGLAENQYRAAVALEARPRQLLSRSGRGAQKGRQDRRGGRSNPHRRRPQP